MTDTMATMKISPFALAAGLFLAVGHLGAANAGWVSPEGTPLPETEDMRSAGIFAAQLVLTTEDALLRKNWITTKGTPTLPSTSTVAPKQNLRALIVFHGCKPNKFGYCNVLADYSVQSPDGTVTPIGTGPVWKGPPAKVGFLQLGQVSADIPFVSTSLAGTYTIRAVVRDTVANAVIPLANSRLIYTKP